MICMVQQKKMVIAQDVTCNKALDTWSKGKKVRLSFINGVLLFDRNGSRGLPLFLTEYSS